MNWRLWLPTVTALFGDQEQRARTRAIQVLRAYASDPDQLLPGTICLAWSPDGTALVTAGSPDGSITLWETASATAQQHWRSPSGVTAVAFAPDGGSVIGAGAYGTVGRYRIRGMPASESDWFGPLDANLETVAFGENGQWAATASWDGDIWVWDANNGEERASFRLPAREWIRVAGVAHQPDQLVGVSDAAIRQWDVTTGLLLHEHVWQRDTVVDAAVHLASDTIAVSDAVEPGIALLALSTLKRRAVLHTQHATASAIAFAPPGDLLAAAHEDGYVTIWNVRTARSVCHWRLDASLLTALAWHPSQPLLAAGDVHGQVWLLALTHTASAAAR